MKTKTMTLNNLDFFAHAESALPQESEISDAEYWCNANKTLTKGYELSVPLQNILDDINECLSDQFRHQTIDVSTMTQDGFQQLVNAIDLTRLGMFIGHKGIDHRYYLDAGMGSKKFRLDIDLKCIPTVLDPVGGVAASICFISAKLAVGNVIHQGVAIKYIGSSGLENQHRSVIEHGKNATNHQLGKWLKFMRSLSVDQQPTLISTLSLQQ